MRIFITKKGTNSVRLLGLLCQVFGDVTHGKHFTYSECTANNSYYRNYSHSRSWDKRL